MTGLELALKRPRPCTGRYAKRPGAPRNSIAKASYYNKFCNRHSHAIEFLEVGKAKWSSDGKMGYRAWVEGNLIKLKLYWPRNTKPFNDCTNFSPSPVPTANFWHKWLRNKTYVLWTQEICRKCLHTAWKKQLSNIVRTEGDTHFLVRPTSTSFGKDAGLYRMSSSLKFVSMSDSSFACISS